MSDKEFESLLTHLFSKVKDVYWETSENTVRVLKQLIEEQRAANRRARIHNIINTALIGVAFVAILIATFWRN